MFFHLYSLKFRESIDVSPLSEDEIKSLWDVIARKSDVSNGWSNGCIRLINTDKTKNNFKEIIEIYGKRVSQIQRLYFFLNEDKKVDPGAFFYVFNSKHSKLYEKMAAIEVLKCDYRNWAAWGTVHNRTFDVWSRICFEFDVHAFGIDGILTKIGEKDKTKRRCRFCNEYGKSYSHRAHAIPEAIGNKLLLCNEECDECNTELKSVEENFIRLMDFRRSMYRIESKDCKISRKIKGVNYTISPDDNGYPILNIKQSSRPVQSLSNGESLYKFDHYDTVIDQDIYRALAKMVIDVIPSEKLPHFQKTVEWIKRKNQDVIPDALPSVLFGTLPEGNMYEQPVLYLFFRHEDDNTMPYCTAILFTTDIAYQFVMPYVDEDDGRFKYDDELTVSRNRICKYFNIQWEAQQYYSWWDSNIWNYWPVDLSSARVRILPDNDPIFKAEKRYTLYDNQEFDKRLFSSRDINNVGIVSFSGDEIIAQLKKSKQVIPIFEPDKFNLNFRFDLNGKNCHLTLKVPFMSGDKMIDFWCAIDSEIGRLDLINCYDRYITGQTFQTLVESVWAKSIRSLNRFFSLKSRCPAIEIFHRQLPYDILRLSTIEFITPQEKLIKTDFRSVVE